MSLKKFNDKTAKTTFIYRRDTANPYHFFILGAESKDSEYVFVGEYTVVDTTEDTDLTEKKLINLTTLLNGKKDLIELGNLTKTRILFNIVPNSADPDKTTIIFRSHDGKGTSKENAVLKLEKGVYQDG